MSFRISRKICHGNELHPVRQVRSASQDIELAGIKQRVSHDFVTDQPLVSWAGNFEGPISTFCRRAGSSRAMSALGSALGCPRNSDD
jgi:hypothetical protein